MKNLFRKLLKPIIQIEEESIEFKVGFWKGLWAILLWQFLTVTFSLVGNSILGFDFSGKTYTLMIIFDIISIPLISLILINTFGKLTWRKNTFKKFNKKDFLYLALFIVVFRLLFDAFIFPILNLIPQGDLLNSVEELVENNTLYFILSACIVAPIIEEVICRGIVMGGLLKKYSPKVSILLSAFLFAAAHGNIHQGVNAFILGALFGYIYYKTRSIYLTIFCHFVNNTIAFIAFVPETIPGIIINIFVSVAISIPLIILIKKKLHFNYQENFVSTLPDKNIYVYRDL
ncbi:CPBP family intramembrane glutamic endopeptidase [Clostridium paraputrificum]|uniref:CPBP family intramembrane glutamic endopeptidase n=1 Tax=Clostridium TaxID=1485 RepID=UPI003D3276C7